MYILIVAGNMKIVRIASNDTNKLQVTGKK